jgi:protein gp37
MEPHWAREIRDQCAASHVPFFFMQWGGVNKKKTGKMLDGMLWRQMTTSYTATNLEESEVA